MESAFFLYTKFHKNILKGSQYADNYFRKFRIYRNIYWLPHLLIMILAKLAQKSARRQVYLGEYLGTAVLVLVSLFFAYMLNFVPEDWMIGTLGIIPLILGIRAIFTDDDEADEAVEQIEGRGNQSLFWTVTLVTIASGGDNLGIYIPYFAGLEWGQIPVAIAVFAVGVAALCAISYRFSRLPLIAETIEKYEKIIIPVVFIGLGFYIMWENGTIQHFLGA